MTPSGRGRREQIALEVPSREDTLVPGDPSNSAAYGSLLLADQASLGRPSCVRAPDRPVRVSAPPSAAPPAAHDASLTASLGLPPSSWLALPLLLRLLAERDERSPPSRSLRQSGAGDPPGTHPDSGPCSPRECGRYS